MKCDDEYEVIWRHFNDLDLPTQRLMVKKSLNYGSNEAKTIF